MKPILFLLIGFAVFGIFADAAKAVDRPGGQMVRTQKIDVAKGWNAIFLEVEPLDPAPDKVFKDLAVDIAGGYFPQEASTQFVNNPSTQLFKGQGWGVWYAESRPDAFLKTLNAVYGQQAYLIHATAAFQWNVTGLVSMAKVHWQPNAFTLTGFSVKSVGAPTFAEYFAASSAHAGQAIYRLAGDVWRKVTNPAAEAMKSGEAYWIYTKGGSEYQGPLAVEVVNDLLTLSPGGSVVLRNLTDHPLTPHLNHVTVDGNPVPISINVRVLGEVQDAVKYVAAEKPAGEWQQEMPPLEAGARLGIPFSARTSAMTAYEQASLLKISTDMGTEQWVPVVGRRPDLEKK